MFYTKGIWHQQKYFIDQIQDQNEKQQRINRLRRMMNFSEQSECRWLTILRYFGERPRTLQCMHCDNCLGQAELSESDTQRTTVDPADPPEPPGQIELSPLTAEEEALYEALRETRTRFAREEGISSFIVAANRELAEMARMKPRTTAELLSIKGIGRTKVEKYGDAMISVIAEHTGEAGLDASGSETASDLKLQMADEQKQKQPPEAWQQRFNALAQWRTMTSSRDGCEPSELFSMPAMRQVAEHVPASIDALAAVEGVGSLATERYADEVVLILGITGPEPSEQISEPEPSDAKPPSWQLTVELYQSGHTPLAIAERRMLSPSTVASHLVTGLRRGYEIDLRSALPSSELVSAIQQQLAIDPEASIATLHERLEHRIARSELTLVVAYLRPPEVESD